MTKKKSLGDITPSICEAVFKEYARLDDSLAELIRENHVQVRDFIILSFVWDQGGLSTEQIAQILGSTLTGSHAESSTSNETKKIACFINWSK